MKTCTHCEASPAEHGSFCCRTCRPRIEATMRSDFVRDAWSLTRQLRELIAAAEAFAETHADGCGCVFCELEPDQAAFVLEDVHGLLWATRLALGGLESELTPEATDDEEGADEPAFVSSDR